jgi:hypothetical protein
MLKPSGAKLVRMTVSVFQSHYSFAVLLNVVCDTSAGWVHTNDAWLEPHALPLAEWKAQGAITRRRRWVRRIYLNAAIPAMS